MALHGTFVLNNADYAPQAFPEIGTFMAFSGNGMHRNKLGSICITGSFSMASVMQSLAASSDA